MTDPRILPYAIFGPDEEFAHLSSPERKLHYQILVRALEDVLLPCNKIFRVSAINWFKRVVEDPPVTFDEVCVALELSPRTVTVILSKVLVDGKRETKRKSWRTRIG